jgi:general secretion pathway protein G
MSRGHRKACTRKLGPSNSGFTLLELLIVIVFLGILAGVVVFALGGVSTQSAQAACNSDARIVETAVVAFHNNPNNTAATNQYPAAGAAGEAELTAPASAHFGGPYLRTWPNNHEYYAITLDPTAQGQVDVQPSGSPTPLNFDGSSDPCSSVP